MCARHARGRWALVVALLVSLVAAASAHASGPRAARRALRADVPTSVTGDSLVVTDADPDASSSSIDAALVRRVAPGTRVRDRDVGERPLPRLRAELGG